MPHATGHGENLSERSCCFLIKIFNFYQKKTTSLRRNPSRTPFEHSEKQCVVRQMPTKRNCLVGILIYLQK